MLELRLYDAEVCSCGHHRSLTNHPDADFAIEVETCDVCASVAKFQRIQQAADEKALRALGKDPDAEAARPDDGRHLGVRLVKLPDQIDQ